MLVGIIGNRNSKDEIAKLAPVKVYLNGKKEGAVDTSIDFEWKDIISGGVVKFVQSSSSDTLRPSYNDSTGLVTFNNSDILTANTLVQTTTPNVFCIYAVVEKRWGGGDYFFIGRDTVSSPPSIRVAFRYDRLSIQIGASFTYEFTTLIAQFGAGSSGLCVVAIEVNGTNIRLRINGVYHSATIMAAWVTNFSIKYLGYDIEANKTYAGALGAIVLYDASPSTTDTNTIETTLKTNFGITF